MQWSKRYLIPGLSGFDIPQFLDNSINSSVTAHTIDNHFGGTFSFNYDVLNKNLVQEQFSGFYNSQCCGVAFQYQTYNYGGALASIIGIPADHRFFLSFTLAGLGNFSPFNGGAAGAR